MVCGTANLRYKSSTVPNKRSFIGYSHSEIASKLHLTIMVLNNCNVLCTPILVKLFIENTWLNLKRKKYLKKNDLAILKEINTFKYSLQ